jgi:aspartyl-tRNA(Asn)/glutamyl-tRNA(Gln) amidotransferase subunit A
MARTAEDCALLLSAICGPDPDRDSTVTRRSRGRFHARVAGLHRRPAHRRAEGVPGEGVSADVRAAIESALRQYEKLGAKRVEISLPRTELAIPSTTSSRRPRPARTSRASTA